MNTDRRMRLWSLVVEHAHGRPAAVKDVCAAVTSASCVDSAAVAVMLSATPRETMCASDQVASELEELALTLGEGPCVDAFVDGPVLVGDLTAGECLAPRCVQLLGISAAGLLLTDGKDTLQVVAASSEKTRLLELFQLQIDQGPCVDCFRTGHPVSVADLPTAGRWPRFTAAAAEVGFTAVHALPMRLRTEIIGALNFFDIDPGELDEGKLRIGQAVADVATIGLLQHGAISRRDVVTAQLQTALNSRILIEQAKGVLASIWTWPKPSPCCAAVPAATTGACPSSPRPSSTVPSRSRRGQPPTRLSERPTRSARIGRSGPGSWRAHTRPHRLKCAGPRPTPSRPCPR